ncbi:DUF2523 family protein [Pseudomonas sp. 2FE]|uniref:DUF2523 family protein n=1 Tax=Pseudomonas sp. 2FE TaxID=2502190 RepID=UPI001C4986F5|nr:DUF2523 family protein [Pseudomonas sp. 2FE]
MIATIANWFSALFAWIARIFQWFTGMFKDFMEFVTDLPVVILNGILDGAIYVLSMIPVPGFMAGGGLQSLFNGLPADVLYFVNFFGIHIGLGIIGAGVVFRLTRKGLTLGQW